MNHLPNEIITLIVQHCQLSTLYECTLVSKQFNVITNPFLWHTLNFANTEAIGLFIAAWTPRTPTHRLCIEGRHWTNQQLTRLLPYLRRLDHVSIARSANISHKGFLHLPRLCRHLTSLQLDVALTKGSFVAIGRQCHHLTDLNWRVGLKQFPEWLESLHRCPLRRLTIYSVHPLNATLAILQQFALTHLSLTGPGVTSLRPLPSPWPLTHLTLIPCQIDNDSLHTLIQTHPNLRDLDLRYTQWTDQSLDVIRLPHLTHLTLTTSHSSIAIQRLLRQCPNLQVIRRYMGSNRYVIIDPHVYR